MNKIISLYLTFFLLINPGIVFSSTATDNSVSEPASMSATTTEDNAKNHQTELIIIIDAHENIQAQYNIAKLINTINTQSPLSTIFIEGASGEVTPETYFSIFDDQKTSYSTFNYLLKRGFITGTEYWRLLSDRKTAIIGAENPIDYRNNIKHLVNLKQLSNKDSILPLITFLNKRLRNNLPPNLLEVDKQYIKMVTEGTDVLNFVYSIINEYSEDIQDKRGKYPILSKFLMFSQKSSKINSDLIKAIGEIQEKNSSDKNIATTAGSLKKQLIFATDQMNSLHESMDFIYSHKNDVDKFLLSRIISYYENTKFINNLSTSRIYLSILNEYKSLFSNTLTQKTLFQTRDSLLGLYKGCNINLTSAEFTYFNIDTIDPALYLNTFLEADNSSDFVLYEIVKAKRLEQIYQIKQTVCDFYHAVEQRNNSILNNITKNLHDGEKAVLVIGGYHKNICEQVQESGIQVTVITPEVKLFEQSPRDVSYSDYLSGKFTELEKMIYYSWSTIVSPIVSQDINRFSTRQEAIPTIVSRQIALMIGTGLIINQNIADNASRKSINDQIATIQKQAASSNYAINNAFSILEGSENEPQWPQVSDFSPIADKNGVFVTFKIGNRLLGLQLLKEDSKLTSTEKNAISSIQTGHISEESIIFDGNVYSLSLSNITAPYKSTAYTNTQAQKKTQKNNLIELITPFTTDPSLANGNAQLKAIKKSFEEKINNAASAKNLDDLYDIYDYLENIIASKALTESYLNSLKNLKSDQIKLIQQQIDPIINSAIFYRVYLELKIADSGGELRGFKFIKPLGSGSWGNVYLARKDGQLWAVKLLKVTPSTTQLNFTEGRRKHLKEAVAIISVYDDVYTGYCGRFNRGENVFISVPYEAADTLRAKQDTMPQNLNDLVNLSLSITNEMSLVEKNGFVFNDLKPENILIRDRDSSARIIDFGCCFSKKFPPKDIDQITLGSTDPYRSPELQSLTEIIYSLEIEMGMAYMTPIDEMDVFFLERIEYLLNNGIPYINDFEKYQNLLYNIIPECYDRLENGEFSSTQELIDLLEKEVLSCLFSMVDHRSDIYAFGIILRDDIFNETSNPRIKRIIAKACNENPQLRYQSFQELYNDLSSVSNVTKGPLNKKAIAAHFIGQAPEFDMNELTQTVESWERLPFNKNMYDDVSVLSEFLSFSQPTIQQILQKTLKPKTYSEDGNTAVFQSIIANLSAQLETMQDEQDYLEFKVDSEPRPIRIHLVPYNELRTLGVSGLTIPSDNRIDMYLPGNLLSTRHEVFLQIFKHELDEYIFKLPHTTAVLLEPLMQHYGYIRIGKASRRTLYEFRSRMDNALLTRNLDQLYSLKQELKELMTNEQQAISSIEQNPALSDEEKKFAKRLAKDISNECKFFSFQVDNYIARLGGTLQGFKFIKRLGSGLWGTVYLASKDNRLWAVKMLNVDRDKKTLALSDKADLSLEMHNNEISLTNYAYNDVYQGEIGHFDEGDNQLIAVPFFEGETLSQRFLSLSNDEAELIDTTLPVVNELIDLEDKGIIFNDFNPQNIYFKSQSDEVRFIDFGCAMKSGMYPDKLAEVTIGATTPFISPEFQICRKLRANLASVFDLLESTPFEKIQEEFPDIFEVFLSQAVHAGANKTLHKEIQNTLFPAASKKIESGEIKSQSELIAFIEPELVRFILSLMDIRSDIYSFGKLLEHEIFIVDVSPEVSRIIKKATAHQPEDRYQSFKELYSDLMTYRETIGSQIPISEIHSNKNTPEHSLTAHFIGVTPTLNENYINSLNPMPISKDMLTNLENYSGYLTDRYDSIKTILESTLYPGDTSEDAGFSVFNTILKNLTAEFKKADKEQNSITIEIPGQSRPLNIHLVSLTQLNQAGVSALTVPHADRIDMYLPYEYFNVSSITTFLQTFKHEIDEFVFSAPHTLSVLHESLFTASSPDEIGTASERVTSEFQTRFNEALAANNLSELYSLKNYFKGLINNEATVIAEIRENDKLTPAQQQYAIRLAGNITQLSVYFSLKLENAIADNQGILAGYKFLSKFTETNGYSVYIAQQNNKLFFVKIIKPTQNNIAGIAESQTNEMDFINTVYGDASDNLSGIIGLGGTPFYTVPFNEGSMLNKALLPESETELLQTAVLIAGQIKLLEQNNVVSNNISPQTIFTNETLDSARIVNFTGSINLTGLPDNIDSLTMPEPTVYHSPEYTVFYNNFQKLKDIITNINALPVESIDNKIFDEIKTVLSELYDLSDRQDIYDNLVSQTIPEIMLALSNGEITEASQITGLIVPDAISFMTGAIDSRSDIYSFGMLLANDLFPVLTDKKLNSIIAKATHPDKSQRYSDMAELQEALESYLANISVNAYSPSDQLKNVAFGTISETDHRRAGGLNSKIRRIFTKKIERQNPIEEFELIQAQIQLWDYNELAQDTKTGAILKKMGITDNAEWNKFTQSLKDRFANANIYYLPSESFMLWVGNQFAAAHYGKYNDQDNIYLTSPLMKIMQPQDKTALMLHEMLHIMGFSHEEAEIFLTAVIPEQNTYNEVKEFLFLVAQLESANILQRHGRKNFNQLIEIISPVLKNALAQKKVLSKDNFRLTLKKLKFEPAFIDLAYEEINNILVKNSKGTPPSQAIKSDQSTEELNVSPEHIASLIPHLVHENELQTFDAIDELIGIGDPAVNILTESLSSQHPTKLINILYVLGEIGNPASFEPVSRLFSHESADVRQAAFTAAEKLVEPSNAADLQKMLQSANSAETISELIKLLGKINQPPNLDNRHFIANSNPEIRALTAQILDKQGIDRSQDIQAADEVWTAIHNLAKIDDTPKMETAIDKLRSLGQQALPYLRLSIQWDNADVVAWSAFLLAEHKDVSAVKPLLQTIQSFHGTKKDQAISFLLKNDAYEDALIKFIQSESSILNEHAIEILKQKKSIKAVPVLQDIVLDRETYSVSNRLAAIKAIAELLNDKDLSAFINNATAKITRPLERAFDDKLVLIEIAVIIKNRNLRKSSRTLRFLLREQSIQLKKAAIEGLGVVGKYDDISSIQLFARLYPELVPAAKEATANLKGLDKYLASLIGLFLAGEPNKAHVSPDNSIHKNELSGVQDIMNFSDFNVTPFSIRIGSDNFSFTMQTDTDFSDTKYINTISQTEFSEILQSILKDNVEICRGLQGKTIYLSLLDSSYRLSESHLSDSFIGFNKALLTIKNKEHLKTLISILMLHELKHEAGIAPLEGDQLLYFEQAEFIKMIEFLNQAFTDKNEFSEFIDNIAPAFAENSFFIHVLRAIADENISLEELKVIYKLNIGNPSNDLIDTFYTNLNNPQANSFSVTNNLSQLGLLSQDISQILSLSPESHLKGDLDTLQSLSPFIKNEIHSILLEGYLRQLAPELIKLENLSSLFDLFFGSYEQSTEDARNKIDSYKSQLMSEQQVQYLSDSDFIEILTADLIYSKFTGKNEGIFQNTEFRTLMPHVEVALANSSILNTVNTQEKISLLEQILSLSSLHNIPVELNIESEQNQSDNFKINLDKSTNAIIETSM